MDDFISGIKLAWTWLPSVIGAIGGFFAGVFYVVQLYESRTFQHWKNNFLAKYRAKKLAKLKAREKIVLAQIKALEKIRHARVEAREIVAEATADAAKLLASENSKADVTKVVESTKPLSK